jgi:hypothetical protein
MKTTLTAFIAYLESLATANADIAHNPEIHPAFIRFYEAGTGELTAQNKLKATLRTKIKNLPCVLIKDYDFTFSDNRGDNLQKVREIEFLVIDQISRSTKDVYEIWERTKEIGDEFVIRMKDDKRNRRNPAIIGFDLDNVRGVPADVGDGSLFGTSYTVKINSIRSNDPEPDKWNDL